MPHALDFFNRHLLQTPDLYYSDLYVQLKLPCISTQHLSNTKGHKVTNFLIKIITFINFVSLRALNTNAHNRKIPNQNQFFIRLLMQFNDIILLHLRYKQTDITTNKTVD